MIPLLNKRNNLQTMHSSPLIMPSRQHSRRSKPHRLLKKKQIRRSKQQIKLSNLPRKMVHLDHLVQSSKVQVVKRHSRRSRQRKRRKKQQIERKKQPMPLAKMRIMEIIKVLRKMPMLQKRQQMTQKRQTKRQAVNR